MPQAAGLVEKVVEEKAVKFVFPDCGELPLPILHIDEVSFSYSGKPEDYLYKGLDLSVDLDSRIALVGPNGAGMNDSLSLLPPPSSSSPLLLSALLKIL